MRSLIDADALRVLHRAARVLLDDLPQLTDRLVAALQEQEPAYRTAVEGDAVATWQEVHRSLRHSISSLLDPRGARDGRAAAPGRSALPAPSRACPWTRCCTASGWAARWCGRAWWTRRPGRRRRTYGCWCMSRPTWDFVDEHCTIVADAYRQTERQMAWRRENRVRLLAAALLDGTSRIADLPEAAEALDLPEHGRYVVVAVEGTRSPGCTGAQAALAPDVRVHWHTGVDAEHGIVLVEGDPSAIVPDEQPPGVRVGVSGVVDGLAAVGEARQLADTALRLCPEAGGTVRLDEHLRRRWSRRTPTSPRRWPTGSSAPWPSWNPPTPKSSSTPSPPGWPATAPPSARPAASTATATRSSTASAATNN